MDKYRLGLICEFLFLCLCVVNQVEWIEAKKAKRWEETPVVETSVGKVRGRVLESRLGEPFYAFRGMPYAQSPINGLRFIVRDGSAISKRLPCCSEITKNIFPAAEADHGILGRRTGCNGRRTNVHSITEA